MRLAEKRLKNIELSSTYAILDKARELKLQGLDILDLSGGEPDFDTPNHIIKAAVDAMKNGNTHYTPSKGDPKLLEAISKKLKKDNNIIVDPKTEIIITPSAKHALFIAILTIVDEGDEVIIPTPSWVSYKSMVNIAGGIPIELPLTQNYRITIEELEKKVSSKTKAIIINTPNNPTGHVLDKDEANVIATFAKKYDLVIITDEIYEKIIYEKKNNFSIASLQHAHERTLTINGFSKAYAMTGWRLGYIAGPKEIIKEVLKFQQHTVGCAGSFIQTGGVEALLSDQSYLDDMVKSYEDRKNFIVESLNAIEGIYCPSPEGAFYVCPSIKLLNFGNSFEFSKWLLDTALIAVTPGTAFSSSEDANDFIRLSFATDIETLKKAIARIRNAVESINNSQIKNLKKEEFTNEFI
ncbi:pyridoxal phosphate-dependent aminotransferase [Acinetobacter pittii]|uniref:pyridoxal phosphate-dependent aminotransferase n=1 Tax=Acinetobacter pittii TaxID=48296 RepID=UPI001CD70640|nr:pyridoxal phosphate-dependent aminotransferase [Acinetobacter pittii]